MKIERPDRRTVLKGIGGSIVGGMAITGLSGANPSSPNPGQNKTHAWADGHLFDMLDADHLTGQGDNDQEGNEKAHEPIYIIDTLEGEDSGIAGACHSPHFVSSDGTVRNDHVVPLPPGFNGDRFTVQWHITRVTDGEGNNVNQDRNDNYLLSAADIEAAADKGDITLVEVPHVFTCPIATHAPPGHTCEDHD